MTYFLSKITAKNFTLLRSNLQKNMSTALFHIKYFNDCQTQQGDILQDRVVIENHQTPAIFRISLYDRGQERDENTSFR